MSTKPRSYSGDWAVPTSIGIWGATRPTRNRLALAVARRIDPEFYWLQALGTIDSHAAPDLSLSERIPSGYLFYLRPAQLSPLTQLGNVTNWFVREDVDADTRLHRISDFMGVPSLARNLVDGRSAQSSTKTLVIADANLAEPFLPLEEGGLRPFIEALNQYATTLIVTVNNRPNPNARDIDYLLQLRVGPEEEESAANVECGQGPPPGTPGLFTQGNARRLNALVEELRQGRSGAPRE